MKQKKSREEMELEIRAPQPNYPGYTDRLIFRPLKVSDTKVLAPVMKRSADHIKGYVHWGTNAKKWHFKDVQNFVSARMRDEFPRFHFVFFIGPEPVAFGSLAPMNSPYDAQVSLAVFYPHQGKGIGKRVVKTLEWYAFTVWGFHNLYYQADDSNLNSKKLAEYCGFTFSHTFEQQIDAEMESGLWSSYKKKRDPSYPDGAFQGADLEYWGIPRDTRVLEALLKYQLENPIESEQGNLKDSQKDEDERDTRPESD
jgi:RimJ/RimL family protein N-acetyltransferase